MMQEQKELLLKDLCARLPYKVKVEIKKVSQIATLEEIDCSDDEMSVAVKHENGEMEGYDFDLAKPYLYPISSMTNEQKEFIKNKFCYDWDIDDHPYSLWAHCISIGDIDELIDWFHKNHIDYRGLIPIGLAIDATELNIY